MTLTTEKLMQYAGELAIVKIAHEEEIASLTQQAEESAQAITALTEENASLKARLTEFEGPPEAAASAPPLEIAD